MKTIPKKSTVLASISNRKKVIDLIERATEIPIKYTGSLPPFVKEELERKGWNVKNTFKASPHDGPGTLPTWELS